MSGVIAADQLDAYLGTAAVYDHARARAASVLKSARRARAAARIDASRLREQVLADARSEAAAAVCAARDGALRDVVTWLVEEKDLEAIVAERVASQCRAWVGQAVAAFAGEADRDALIARRIGDQLHELESHGRFTVRVAIADAPAVRRCMPEKSGFELTEDARLAPGHAVIDSPFVRMDIDLNRQLDDLLAAIAGDGARDGGLTTDDGRLAADPPLTATGSVETRAGSGHADLAPSGERGNAP